MNRKSSLLLCFPVCLVLLVACKKDHVNKVPVADAGNPHVITLPTDTANLVGTGTDVDGSVVGYLWSQVSGPVTSDILNPGSASSLVNFTSAGKYVFQLMVVDNDGATGLDTVSVVVNPPLTDTVNFQPSQNQDEVMIWGNSTNLEESWAGSPETGAAAWTSGDVVYMRGALRFDLSQIPPSATILSANLYLYSDPHPINGDLVHANAGIDNTLLVEQITQSWTASSVKWTAQPPATTENQVVVPSTDQPFLDLNIDVKAMVANMVAQNANYGFLLRLQNENPYTSRMFCSSFNADAAKYPRLVIVLKN